MQMNPKLLLRLEHVNSECGVCSRHACPLRALIVGWKRDSKVINRVACLDVLSGGARMFDAWAWAVGSVVWVLDAIEGCQ